MKKKEKERFLTFLNAYQSKYGNIELVCSKYEIRWRDTITVIDISKILYIEAYARHIMVYTLEGVYKKVGKICEEEEKLTKYGFVRIHQGFLVNMMYIKQISQHEMILNNNISLEISFRRKKMVLLEYEKYLKNHAIS